MGYAKALAKLIVAWIFFHFGFWRFLGYLKRTRTVNGDVVILMYHRVVANIYREHTQPGIAVSADTFDAQIAFLKKHCHVIGLEELIFCIDQDRPLPPRTVVVTFDDGWEDNYRHAYPILRQHGVPAIIFLATDFIGTGNVLWFHKLGLLMEQEQLSPEARVGAVRQALQKDESDEDNYGDGHIDWDRLGIDTDYFVELMKDFDYKFVHRIISYLMEKVGWTEDDWSRHQKMLNWHQVKEMIWEGMEFGSHGLSHRIFATLNEEELRAELEESKLRIESRTEHSVQFLAYPNGDFNNDIIEATRQSGYRAALTTAASSTATNRPDKYALARIGVHEGTSLGPTGKFSHSLFAFGISGWQNSIRSNI